MAHAPVSPSLQVDLAPGSPGGLRLSSPIVVACGSAGWAGESHVLDLTGVGAVVVGPVALRRRPLRPGATIVESPSGLVHALEWPGPGLEAALGGSTAWQRLGPAVIVNVAAFREEEWLALVEPLGSSPGVAAIELDLSCPDQEGGEPLAQDPERVRRLLGSLRPRSDVPLIAKLPAGGRVVDAAVAARAGGADAICVVNGVSAMVVDVRTRQASLDWRAGVLSGPAIRPIALRIVREVAEALPGTVIVGAGGVTTAEDALQFLMAGARAVAIGAAALVDPVAPARIAADLADWMRREGVADVNQLVGVAR